MNEFGHWLEKIRSKTTCEDEAKNGMSSSLKRKKKKNNTRRILLLVDDIFCN